MMREYTMTDRLYKILEGKGASLNCGRCGKELRVGDRVLSKLARGKGRSKRWHKKCWEEGFV